MMMAPLIDIVDSWDLNWIRSGGGGGGCPVVVPPVVVVIYQIVIEARSCNKKISKCTF